MCFVCTVKPIHNNDSSHFLCSTKGSEYYTQKHISSYLCCLYYFMSANFCFHWCNMPSVYLLYSVFLVVAFSSLRNGYQQLHRPIDWAKEQQETFSHRKKLQVPSSDLSPPIEWHTLCHQ